VTNLGVSWIERLKDERLKTEEWKDGRIEGWKD
jgi:hypothetical protein